MRKATDKYPMRDILGGLGSFCYFLAVCILFAFAGAVLVGMIVFGLERLFAP